MNFAERFENLFRKLLPSPFTIAVLLTLFSIILSLFFAETPSDENKLVAVMGFWEKGIWEPGLLAFAVQMMLILVLGHTLALSPYFSRLIQRICSLATTGTSAAGLVAFFTLLISFFNWGLGLIFGAIIARQMGEKFAKEGKQLNYPLIGAAGYSGLMIWHGGISGSAPAKAAEPEQIKSMMSGILDADQILNLPEQIPFSDTVFSSMNLSLFAVLLIGLPLLVIAISRKTKAKELSFQFKETETKINPKVLVGAEKLDHNTYLSSGFAVMILAYALYLPFAADVWSWNFITPNYINLSLLGMAILAHGSFSNFLIAIDKAIGGASGILLQFPLYFGIMGIMKHSGLISDISEFFVSISDGSTFPIFTFFSAGLVNIFVPSGGGQWAIQGPILVEAAIQMNTPIGKNIMAMAYGDQLTNMLQPFWALPLLSITGLKAREIVPYTIILMAAGTLVFVLGLILF